MTLTLYDGVFPKSGKKLITIGGRKLFVRPLKKLLYIYDINTRVLICVGPEENKQLMFESIVDRLDEIRNLDAFIEV